jgi:hypothetical protein
VHPGQESGQVVTAAGVMSSYRIVMEDDDQREYIVAVDDNDVAIAGAAREHGYTVWSGYLTDLVKQHTQVWTNGHALFTSRGTAVNWIETIAQLYTRSLS